jgi:serine/threonine protein kinase
MAPEVLRGKGYGFSCDWWSFGCLLFEMLVGRSLFAGERATTDGLLIAILHKEPLLEEDSPLSPDARDLLGQLLVRSPRLRLTEPRALKAHPFFKEIDWRRLADRQVEPPFVPEPVMAADAAYLRMMNLAGSSVSEGAPAQCHFEGFSFSSR